MEEEREDLLNRLTIYSSIYRQTETEEPEGLEIRIQRSLSSLEQVYERRTMVGKDWRPIDTGYIKDNAGLLVIENRAGFQNASRIPTEEEKARTAKKVVELCVDDGTVEIVFARIPPGEAFPFPPENLSLWRIRCIETAPIRILAIPN